MAIKLSKVNGINNNRDLIYIVDEENEKNNIPDQDKVQGTEVIVVEDGKTYKMNSSGEWIQKSGSNGGGGSGSSILINKTITSNGTYIAANDNADGYKKVVANVTPDLQSKSINISANGQQTVSADHGKDGLSSVAIDVDVPNSYAAGDEGKVVSNGALVSQSSETYTQNNTYDTTLINSVTVNVSGGSILIDKTITSNGTYTAANDEADGYKKVIANVSNSYAAGDEGKVVSGGALVSQSSATYTENNTYDTTLVNSVTVNVSGDTPSVQEKDVNFYDYNGTLLHSYTAQEFSALESLPANPSHSGLTAQGWNWTLADAKNYVASYKHLDVGQQYVTSDGKTRIYIHLVYGKSTIWFGICVDGSVDVNWGDNSADSLIRDGTSLTTIITIQHVYSPGDYVITITPRANSEFSISGSTACSRLISKTSAASRQPSMAYYSGAITKVELGQHVSLGEYAFYSCPNLKSVSIPSSLTSIPSYSFRESGINVLCVPSGVTSIGDYATTQSSRAKICLPKSATTLGAGIFSQTYYTTTSLSSFWPAFAPIVPISAFASFAGAKLLHIEIPDTVTEIQASAFQNNYDLLSITFRSIVPATITGANAFQYVQNDCKIYVPYVSLADYFSANRYPNRDSFIYAGFATYNAGAALPDKDTTNTYDVVWYANKEDLDAQTNPITQGTGGEIYCRYS